ncbi:hypothetical protein [Acinetobacter boissieri]|nr:hypothetical protein [Acinetobacter boissieri]
MMTEDELLTKALYSSATIHQPHALKAYIATKYLVQHEEFNIKNIWQHTASLIDRSEIYTQINFATQIHAPVFTVPRIKRILSLGLYPASYVALRQWYDRDGFESIFHYYVEKSTERSQYLSHHITLLFALNTVYDVLDTAQVEPFLDRVAEFITCTFSEQQVSSLLPQFDPKITLSINFLLKAALKQPGFFCHNLITLVWIIRYKNKINASFFEILLFQLYLQVTLPLDDPEDELDSEIYQQTQGGNKNEFNKKINMLIWNYSQNLHQITLADALVFLQAEFPEYTFELTKITDYQIKFLDINSV